MSDSYDSMPPAVREGFGVYIAGGARSLSKTAELLDVPAGTVRSWAHRYQWRSLAKDQDQDQMRGAVESAAVVASRQHLANIQAAIDIRDNPKSPAVARLRAIEWLSSIGGLVPTQRVELDRGSDEAKGEALAVGDLIALAAAGNMAALIAIAQGRTPAALPASTDPDILDSD